MSKHSKRRIAMKILVIDDTQKNLDSAIQTLKGHDVTLCNSYDEAVELLNKESFEAVLSDLMMPVRKNLSSDGSEFVEKETAVGWSLALLAAIKGAKYVAVLTNLNHHKNIESHIVDNVNREIVDINGAKVLITNRFQTIAPEGTMCPSCKGTGMAKIFEHSYKCSCSEMGVYGGFEDGKHWGDILKRVMSNHPGFM